MFSGIVEAQAKILSTAHSNDLRDQNGQNALVRIKVERPRHFTDLHAGDSICTSGVCLTVESFDDSSIQFALGAETLSVTGWSAENLKNKSINLERSLRMGDRIHGHMVSGHVDARATVVFVKDLGGSTQFDVRIDDVDDSSSPPLALERFVWKKGSWAVNGVSLTINSVENGVVSHCLIPETLLRTNLGEIKVGDRVNVEIDMMARGLVNFLETAENRDRARGVK
jgi:riboflavin synthase